MAYNTVRQTMALKHNLQCHNCILNTASYVNNTVRCSVKEYSNEKRTGSNNAYDRNFLRKKNIGMPCIKEVYGMVSSFKKQFVLLYTHNKMCKLGAFFRRQKSIRIPDSKTRHQRPHYETYQAMKWVRDSTTDDIVQKKN